MNYPENIAGAFPISTGVIFQCEPSAYADETLKRAQRQVPLAIVHGKTDPLVGFAAGQASADLFGEAGWPAFHFFVSENGAHMFARLPVNDAIRWLEAQSSDEPARLVEWAEARLKQGEFRDTIAALRRARDLRPGDALQSRMKTLAHDIDTRAGPEAKRFLEKIRAGEPGWIDAFLDFRDQFEFADASREVMDAFQALRAQHEEPAKKAFGEARAAFQQGRAADAYAKYQEIVDKDYASSFYRSVKRTLSERKVSALPTINKRSRT
jgi:hypothetical protein